MMCLRDELSAEVAGIAWVHFIVKLRTGVKMGGAMSLIAIGWDGYIRASGGANKMKKTINSLWPWAKFKNSLPTWK